MITSINTPTPLSTLSKLTKAIQKVFLFSSTISLFAVSIPAFAYVEEIEVTQSGSWYDIPDSAVDARTIMGGFKVTIADNALLTFNFPNDDPFNVSAGGTVIYGANFFESDREHAVDRLPTLVTGGSIYAKGHGIDENGRAIWNYVDDGSPCYGIIDIVNTNLEFEDFSYMINYSNGTLTIDNTTTDKNISFKNFKQAIRTENTAEVTIQNVNQFGIDKGNYGVLSYDSSKTTLNNIKEFTLSNVTNGFYTTDEAQLSFVNNKKIDINNVPYVFLAYKESGISINTEQLIFSDNKLSFQGMDNSSISVDAAYLNDSSEMVAYSLDSSSIDITAKDLNIKGTVFFAGAEQNGYVSVNAEEQAEIYGMVLADAGQADQSQPRKATVDITLGVSNQNTVTGSYKWYGDALSANAGSININLGKGSYWEGRSDDFKDADSAEWRELHGGEFNEIFSNLGGSGRVNVNLNNGAYWNVTGQSWVTKLDGNGTIDLRGSETGGYAIHIGEITGSNTFIVNLDKDNKAQSDMIYVYNGSGADEQNIVISNREEVLSSLEVGDRVRFATVANASGGFVSDGMTTEIKGDSIGTFGKSTQIRDAGVKNVSFKVVYEPYHTDQTSEEEDLGYNGGSDFNDVKPGNEYVDTIYSQGENPYNVYIERTENTDITDAGRTILNMSRANYANAVQMDTLNKRQGEMRYSEGRKDGLWVRMRHDDIGKKSAFRLDNTMVEVGFDSLYEKSSGEFHTGVAFDYMNGDTDYHHISGNGDLDRYGAWMYLTWLGNEGNYSDFIFKFGHIENDFKIWASSTGEKIRGDYENDVFLVSYEQGKKFQNDEKWFIEPQAQLQYAYVTSDEYQTTQGTDVRLDGIHSLIGRVGVRVGKDITREDPLTFYARGDIMHEFLGDQEIKAKDDTGTMHVRYDNDDTWYSAGLGMTYVQNKDTVMYFEAEKVFGASNTGSYIISGGVRFNFD